jgi:hypothetical protein
MNHLELTRLLLNATLRALLALTTGVLPAHEIVSLLLTFVITASLVGVCPEKGARR